MSILLKQERTLLAFGFYAEEPTNNRYYAFIGFNSTTPAINTEYDEVEEGEAIDGFEQYPTSFTLPSKFNAENPYYIIQDYPELLDNFSGNVVVLLATLNDGKYKVVEVFERTLTIPNTIGTRVDLDSEYLVCASLLQLSEGKDIFDFISAPVTPIVAPFTYGFNVYRVLDGDVTNAIGKNLTSLTELTVEKIGTYTQDKIGAEDTLTVGITGTLNPNTTYTYLLTVYYIVNKQPISAEYVLSKASLLTDSVVEFNSKLDKNDLYVAKYTNKIVTSQNSGETLTMQDVSFNKNTVADSTYYLSNLIIQTDKDLIGDDEEISNFENALSSLDISEYAITGKINLSETNLGTEYANYSPSFSGSIKMRLDERDLDVAPDDLILFPSTTTVEYDTFPKSVEATLNPEYESEGYTPSYRYTYYKNGRKINPNAVKNQGEYTVRVEATVGKYQTIVKEATLIITPITLTYTGTVQPKYYDGTRNAVVDVQEVSGILNNEITVNIIPQFDRINASDDAPYTIHFVLVNNTEGNYVIEDIQGTSTISPRPLTIPSSLLRATQICRVTDENKRGVITISSSDLSSIVGPNGEVGVIPGDFAIIRGEFTYSGTAGEQEVPVTFNIISQTTNAIDTSAMQNYQVPTNATATINVYDVFNVTGEVLDGVGSNANGALYTTPLIKLTFTHPSGAFNFGGVNFANASYNPTFTFNVSGTNTTNASVALYNGGNFRKSTEPGEDNIYYLDITPSAKALTEFDVVFKVQLNGILPSGTLNSTNPTQTPLSTTIDNVVAAPFYVGTIFLPYDYKISTNDAPQSLYHFPGEPNGSSLVQVLSEYTVGDGTRDEQMDKEIADWFMQSKAKTTTYTNAQSVTEEVTIKTDGSLILFGYKQDIDDWKKAAQYSGDTVNGDNTVTYSGESESVSFNANKGGRSIVLVDARFGNPSLYNSTGASAILTHTREFVINNTTYRAYIITDRQSYPTNTTTGTVYALKYV